MKQIFLVLAILATAVSASAAYRYLHEQSIVDRCLSGQHGSFDYSTMSCDIETNHTYIAYHVRHPHDEAVAVAAVVSLALFISAYGYITLRSRRG
jgi:hypothetical protein